MPGPTAQSFSTQGEFTLKGCHVWGSGTRGDAETDKHLTGAQTHCCSQRGVPYAFWHLPLEDLPPGYPVFLDINLSEEGAQTWLSWLQEGLLVDDHTQGMQVSMTTLTVHGVFHGGCQHLLCSSCFRVFCGCRRTSSPTTASSKCLVLSRSCLSSNQEAASRCVQGTESLSLFWFVRDAWA